MQKKDLTVSLLSANILSLAFALPIACAGIWLFTLRWGNARLLGGIQDFFGNLPLFLVVFIAGILIHELIHGIAWASLAKIPLRAVRYGFQIKTLTPYAHCPGPVPAGAYRGGTAMPGLVLGILPMLVAIIGGSGWLFAFGLVFTLAAGGDMVILWLLRSVPADKQVEDHPTRAGCTLIE